VGVFFVIEQAEPVAFFGFFVYGRSTMSEENLCPCGSGKTYAECCEPIIKGTSKASSAENLMRARYSAYVKHEIDFIMDSCEQTDETGRPDPKATEQWSRESTWHGLKILGSEPGKEADTEIVEFEATYTTKKGIREVHHERGLFKKINGDWIYSLGLVQPMTVVREGRKIGRNEPCPCGSGKKYKQCCGR